MNVLTALAGSDGGRSGESGNHRAGRVCAVFPDCDHRGGACDVYINRRDCVTCGISTCCELRAYNICGKSCSFWRITNQRRGLGMCFGAKQRQTQQLQQQGGEGPRGAPLRRLRPRAPYRPAGAGRAMLRPEPSPEGAGWKDNARHRIGRSRSRPLGGRSCDYTSWQPSPPCQVHRVTFSFGTLPQPAAKARQRFPSRRPHERMFTSRHSHCLTGFTLPTGAAPVPRSLATTDNSPAGVQ